MTKSRPGLNHSRPLGRGDDRAAGSTPARLPDHLCGPVVVRKVAPAQAEVPEPISLLEQAADRIEALLRQVAALEEVRVSTIRLLDAAEAKATALETELAESRESLARADTRIIELEDNVRQLTVQAEADAKARSRLAALLNPSA